MSWQRLKIPLLCVVCVVLGGVIVWLMPISVSIPTSLDQSAAPHLSSQQITSYRGAVVRQSSVNYRFIAPLLTCDVGSEDAFPEFVPLKERLSNLIEQKVAAGDAQNISLYLRSMLSARWFEIQGDLTYAPASLFKTFVMMAYYKQANETDNPGFLQKQIPFVASPAYGNDVVGGPIVHLANGKLYTIDQVIDQMIRYSDNDAFTTLINNMDADTLSRLESIFHDLNIPLPLTDNDSAVNFISVDEYAMVFRVLFGSTYLSENYSEKALRLLADTKYTDGIVAGVPNNFIVSHKYGVLTEPQTATSSASTQLHDCGIVYYPNHPYLLCVMTKGNSVTVQQSTIKDISATAYQWLDTYYKSLPPSTSTSTAPMPTLTP